MSLLLRVESRALLGPAFVGSRWRETAMRSPEPWPSTQVTWNTSSQRFPFFIFQNIFL